MWFVCSVSDKISYGYLRVISSSGELYHGRSTEAEVREILATAVKPESRARLGEALVALSRDIGLTNEDFEVFDRVRDKTPATPLRLQ